MSKRETDPIAGNHRRATVMTVGSIPIKISWNKGSRLVESLEMFRGKKTAGLGP